METHVVGSIIVVIAQFETQMELGQAGECRRFVDISLGCG
jgi:hypothetical protein